MIPIEQIEFGESFAVSISIATKFREIGLLLKVGLRERENSM